jgi:hypothetical protein
MDTLKMDDRHTVKVLDRGFVKYIDHMGSDLMVANAARVSFNKASDWDVEGTSIGVVPANTNYRNGIRNSSSILQLTSIGLPFAHPQHYLAHQGSNLHSRSLTLQAQARVCGAALK